MMNLSCMLRAWTSMEIWETPHHRWVYKLSKVNIDKEEAFLESTTRTSFGILNIMFIWYKAFSGEILENYSHLESQKSLCERSFMLFVLKTNYFYIWFQVNYGLTYWEIRNDIRQYKQFFWCNEKWILDFFSKKFNDFKLELNIYIGFHQPCYMGILSYFRILSWVDDSDILLLTWWFGL